MTLVDRFICRREGHLPCTTLTKTSGITVYSYITSCQRCGKVFEQAVDTDEDAQATIGTVS